MRLIRSSRDGGKQWREFFHKADRLFNAFLHREIQWHEYGALDLPFDHRSPRWPALGHGKRTPQFTLPVNADTASRGRP